jgi:hypothetical protein
MILSALFSGPASFLDGVLILVLWIGIPVVLFTLLIHQLLRFTGIYDRLVANNRLKKGIYFAVLFSGVLLLWLLFS